MSKEFVPYEQALALKELGFDEPCFSVYYNGEYHEHGIQNQFLHEKNECSAPLYQQAFRWFREKHGLDNAILKDRVVIETEEDLPNWYYGFKTYEEAELECLKKLIEIVKNNKYE